MYETKTGTRQITNRCPKDYTLKVAEITASAIAIESIIDSIGDEQTSQQTSTSTSSKHTRTAHTAVLLLRGLTESTMRLSESAMRLSMATATAKPWDKTVSSRTGAVARPSSASLQGAQKSHKATGLLILAMFFILLGVGLGVPITLGLPVPRTLGESPTPGLLLRDTPLSLWLTILVLWHVVLALGLTVLTLG
jgi:hypothetical protein